MIPKRPINADVPAEEKAGREAGAGEEAAAARAGAEGRRDEIRARRAEGARWRSSPSPWSSSSSRSSGGPAAARTTAAARPPPRRRRPPRRSRTKPPPSRPPKRSAIPASRPTTRPAIGGSDPAANAAGAALAVFPSTTPAQRPAAVTVVGEEDWAGAIAAAVLMAAPVRAPILFSGPDEMPDGERRSARRPRPAGQQGDRPGVPLRGRLGRLPRQGRARSTPATPPAPPPRSPPCATASSAKPPKHIVIASDSRPDFAMPAAAWAARSGDPVLFTGREEAAGADRRGARRHTRRCRSTCSAPPRSISSEVVREIGKISKRVKRVAGEDPVANALALARYRDGSFGWNVNDPGHGFVLARSDSPADAAAAAPLSASGTWGPLLLTDDAEHAAGGGPQLPPRRQARLHHRPHPRLLQPRLGDRRPGRDRRRPAGGSQRTGRACEDRRRRMSESENPQLLGGGQGDHGRGHPRPRRPRHPPLRAAGPQPHPPPDRAAARRPPGAGRRRAPDRPARRARPAQRRAARRPRDLALKYLAPGVWRLKEAPAPADQRLPRRGRPDRRRPALGQAADLRRARGAGDLDAGADPRPSRPPGLREGGLRGARRAARLPRRRRRRDGGTAAGRGDRQPEAPSSSRRHVGRTAAQGRPGPPARATRSPASASSTPPATRPAR